MKYGSVAGPVYCRYARTAPIINSDLAHQYGIEARVGSRTQHAFKLEEGKNVKLRMILEERTRRMTCHARIDWVRKDEATGEYRLGLSHLSLSDDEFGVLLNNFVDEPTDSLAIVDTVRRDTEQTAPVVTGEGEKVIMRDKAVSMPVELIERIDETRGELTFSEFVVAAIRAFLS